MEVAEFKKVKYHYLLHIPDCIRRFGLPIYYSTEVYESMNSLYRDAAIHTNRAAYSKDVGVSIAQGLAIRHIQHGGHWLHDERWWSASPTLLQIMNDPLMEKLIAGSRDNSIPIIGTFIIVIMTGKATGKVTIGGRNSKKRVTVNNGDICNVDDFVVTEDNVILYTYGRL